MFTLISTSEADSAYFMVWICCVVLSCVVFVEEDGEGTVYHIRGAAYTAYWCCCTHHLPSAGQQGFDIVLLFLKLVVVDLLSLLISFKRVYSGH